ncbi:MAG: AsnC family protein [Deltaproteobacteria bacterium]|nr:AsnC family protein [Deltaproteobacteria bacterium]
MKKEFIPKICDSIDTTRFSFDPLTVEILTHIDGRSSVERLAEDIHASRDEVQSRLDALEIAHVIEFSRDVIEEINSKIPDLYPRMDATNESVQQVYQKQNVDDFEGEQPSHAFDSRPPEKSIDDAIKSKFSGQVAFHRENSQVIIHFSKGEPVGVQSTLAEHEYGALLLNSGKISDEVHENYSKIISSEKNIHPVKALAMAGRFSKTELGELVYHRGRTIIEDVKTWQEAAIHSKSETVFPDNIARCSLLPKETFEHKKEKFIWREIPLTEDQKNELHDKMSLYMSVNSSAGKELASMGLTGAEKEFVKSFINEPVLVRYVMSISSLGHATSRRLIYWLLKKNIFTLTNFNPEGSADIPNDELVNYLAHLKHKNEFDILSVHAVTIEKDIKKRIAASLETFSFNSYKDLTSEQERALHEIKELIEDAGKKLLNPKLRRDIREKVWNNFQLNNFYNIQIKKASIALQMRMDYNAAIDLAQSCLEVKPGDPLAFSILNSAKKALHEQS